MTHPAHRPLIFLSIGSNLGDKKANCKAALEEIQKRGIAKLIRVSPFYSTAPVDYLDQDWFINAVAQIDSSLQPLPFLKALKETERQIGTKKKSIRFGPRIIDIDILIYGDHVSHSESLTLPHPRMHQRLFVLRPFCDIMPALEHPALHKTMADLLKEIDGTNQEIRPVKAPAKITDFSKKSACRCLDV